MNVQTKGSKLGKIDVAENDYELIRNAVDIGSICRTISSTRHKVYRYFLFKVGNRLDAQELTSQTFLAALENLASYRGEGSFG